MDGEISRKTKTATRVEATLVSVVLGLGAFYLLGCGVFYLFNRPMDVTAFEVRLQRELQKESGWSGIRANYSPIPWPATRPNYEIVFVTARKNNRIVETSLYKIQKYMLCYLYIDAYYHCDLQKKAMRAEYDGSGVVKVVESVPFTQYPTGAMQKAMVAALEAGIPLENGWNLNNGVSQSITVPLDSQEQQDAMSLADEFGFAVRQALK